MRTSIGLSVLILAATALPGRAQTGVYLPTSPTSYGQDEFRTADGTTCRSSMDGTKRVEVGTYVSGARTPFSNGYILPTNYDMPTQGNAGVYGRFTMSLDATPDRIDCKRLFNLEMEKRELELEVMKRSLHVADERLDALRAERRRRGDVLQAADREPTRSQPLKKGSDIARVADKRGSKTSDDRRRRTAPL